MNDKLEKLGVSLIQHGKHSDRVYLMKLFKEDKNSIVGKLNALADQYDYGKIFCKVPEWGIDVFKSHGYIEEAMIPDYYGGEMSVYFYSRFRDESRGIVPEKRNERIKKNLELARGKFNELAGKRSRALKHILKLDHENVGDLVELYKVIFDSYPFPIYNPDYIKRTMDTNIDYYGIYENGALIATASSEKDEEGLNAEMTDFATLPKRRGQGLASAILMRMEQELRDQGYYTLHTIARAQSAGMNITFSKLGYLYGGTLVNNTQIAGRIESMNVWYKRIRRSA
ncbi:putative beta-lysine N-acetyltransferase [candidate division KSB1 bacterium]|nr:putative beta-lysine N-acetyltransferase [candidate division KSB1 bacterium]